MKTAVLSNAAEFVARDSRPSALALERLGSAELGRNLLDPETGRESEPEQEAAEPVYYIEPSSRRPEPVGIGASPLGDFQLVYADLQDSPSGKDGWFLGWRASSPWRSRSSMPWKRRIVRGLKRWLGI